MTVDTGLFPLDAKKPTINSSTSLIIINIISLFCVWWL